MDDLVVQALATLMPDGVRREGVARDGRTLRWVEAGAGAPAVVFDAALGESAPLAFAGILPGVSRRTRVVAYDRAGNGMSDPVSPLTLDGQVDDLAAVIEATGAPCVVVGHSWGGMLALLLALRRPELVAGLVLLDPADEQYLSTLGPHQIEEGISFGDAVLEQYADGSLGDTVRGTFRSFAERLSDDPAVQALFLDAHLWCFTKESQARMVRDEFRLILDSLEEIRRLRTQRSLPDVPIVVLSATTGQPQPERDAYTRLHEALAGSVPKGQHIVLGDTSHAVNQERFAEVTDAVLGVVDSV